MCLPVFICNRAVLSKRSKLKLELEGERVDLLTFPPVCLPYHGQIFAGELEGTVAGEFSNCQKNTKNTYSNLQTNV